MQIDPLAEWRRLTDYYHSLSNEELAQLAGQFGELTDTAQQVLRGELHSRGLGDPESIARAAENPSPMRASSSVRELPREPAAGPADDSADATAQQAGEGDLESEAPHDFTWKVLLCECEEWKQAWQLGQALHRAGIDNWPLSAGRTGHPYSRVFVAADQLDQARAIASQPVPRDIVEDSEQEPGEYVVPTCPSCGAEDPVLESADPANVWSCEVCGRQWTEMGTEAGTAADSARATGAAEGPKGVSFGISGARDGKSRPATGQLYPQGE
jgi:ribosomal protein L37AE/L43A